MNVEKNGEFYAELIQFLDNKNLYERNCKWQKRNFIEYYEVMMLKENHFHLYILDF